MIIAFQGEPGAYSEAAALKFCPSAGTLPCCEFRDVFLDVYNGRDTLGILPVENSIGGTIHKNYDLLLEYHPHHKIEVVGEVELHINHCLLALPGTKVRDLEVVS